MQRRPSRSYHWWQTCHCIKDSSQFSYLANDGTLWYLLWWCERSTLKQSSTMCLGYIEFSISVQYFQMRSRWLNKKFWIVTKTKTRNNITRPLRMHFDVLIAERLDNWECCWISYLLFSGGKTGNKWITARDALSRNCICLINFTLLINYWKWTLHLDTYLLSNLNIHLSLL